MMDAAREQYLAAVPPRFARLVARAFAGTLSPRQAIKAKCLGCSGFSVSEVEHCTVVLCELHGFRPYQDRKPSEAEASPLPEASL